MPKMTFRGVRVIDFKGVKPEGSDQTFEVSMAADFSDPVRKQLGWDISEELESLFPKLRDNDPVVFDRATMLFPAGVKSMALDGSINAISLELVPNGKELVAHRKSLACTEIGWFSLQRVKQTNGSFVHELRFTAIVHEDGAGAALEGYQKAMGSHSARMWVGYEKQEPLPLEKAEEEEDNQERLISQEQADDTATEDEDGEGEPVAAAPTISPAVLVTGSHQRHSKKDRQQRERDAESRKHGVLPTIDAETEEIVD